MKSNFINRFWKIARWFLAFFLLLFCFRFLYGYMATDAGRAGAVSDYFSGVDGLRKNYASEKSEEIIAYAQNPAQSVNTQKYEKTATVRARTSRFETDNQLIRRKIQDAKAIIQYENAFGLKGARELHLFIGVTPEAFDSFYMAMQQIGTVQSMSVIKEDKTNEYRQLNAQKASLQKTLESLVELKSKGGEISDFVSLHDKILEVESRLQDLGVQLGNFNTENEFCTVRLSLYEGTPKKDVSLLHRIKVALEWSIEYFCYSVAACFIVILSVLILILLMDKLKIMGIINRD